MNASTEGAFICKCDGLVNSSLGTFFNFMDTVLVEQISSHKTLGERGDRISSTRLLYFLFVPIPAQYLASR